VLRRPLDEHLTEAELDLVLSRGLISEAPVQERTGIDEHLMACARCRGVVDRNSKAQVALSQLRIRDASQPGPDCPSVDELQNCAAGILPAEQSGRCFQHAITCDHCGPLLASAVANFADELNPDQRALIDQLESSQVLWQRKLARRLGQSGTRPAVERTRFKLLYIHWFRSAILVASVLMLCISGFRLLRHRGSNDAETVDRLLNQAYTEKRVMDLRLLGAAYGPMAVMRGSGGSSSLDRPAPLLEAQALIASEIRKHPEDTRWQVAKARADLVEGNFSRAAVDTLERVLESTSNDRVRVDLASAYFQTAQGANQASSYGRAADLLGEVISRNPEDQIARFNRAIVFEKLCLYHQAEDEWRRYLELDHDSAWAAEARLRLAGVQEKIKKQGDYSSRPLLTPGEFWAQYSTGLPQTLASLDGDVERYRDEAIKDWLIQAFSGTSRDLVASRAARKGLDALAQLLRRQHSDRWLEDLLKADSSESGFAATVASLSESYRDDAAGKFARVETLARATNRQKKTTENEALRIQNQWQLLFAKRLSLHTRTCLQMAEQLWREVDRTSYQWLRARVLLDYSQCADHDNQLQLAKELNDRCLRLSTQFGFPDLFLRATKVSADLSLQTEGASASMSRAARGLRSFWAGNFIYMSGYNLLTSIDEAAEFERLWYLDANAIAEALQVLGNDPDVGMRAVEQHRLANALVLINDLNGANENLLQARALLAELPDDDANRKKLMEIEVDVAKVDLQRDRPHEALAKLQRIREEVAQTSDNYLSFDFFVAYGKALRFIGAIPDAESALSAAVKIAEKGSRELPEERDRLRWIRHCSPAYREIVGIELLRDPLAALYLWEAFKGASLAGTKLNDGKNSPRIVSSSGVNQRDFRKSLRPGTLMVAYAVFADGISAWTYDGDLISQRWISIPSETVKHLVSRFAADCATPNSDLASLRNQGTELYRILFKPLANLLPSTTSLVVEPDDFLEQIPFAALVDDQGVYLGDRFSLSISPGIDYLKERSAYPLFSRETRALVVGDASSHPELDLRELPGAETEATNVASVFSHPILILGEKASSAKIASALPTVELFHFAGHAVATSDFAGLVLHAETNGPKISVLTATDISKSTLGRLHLVVLSACASEEGTQEGFNDAESLARSLVTRGVSQVIASRWRVDSSSTTVLMRSFYHHLMGKEATVEALRAAEKELRLKNGLAHPFYWAAFSVFGNV
jgi:CHAT domain-containing protein